LILDGQLVRGARYAAGEVGHTVILPDGPLCGCGKRGCLEALASRTAIERDVRAALNAGRPSILAELILADNNRLTSGTIKLAMDQGDELMTEVVGRAQYYLGLLAGNLVNILDPEMIVFGGGVIEALGDSFLDPIRATARPCFLSQRDVDSVQLVPASLGDYAVVFGAAELARRVPRLEGKQDNG
jgi:glucokinase